MEKLKFVSLFCGCGGFDLGFVQAGFKCCGAFDIDPFAVEVHRNNLASPAQLCDLSNGELSVNSFKNIDVLVAGPPCQGFSTVGKRSLDDPRNHLLVRAGEIALIMKPLVFVVENVTGVVSGKHKKYWDYLKKMMQMGEYKTKDLCCDAEKIGLAQTRKRRILIAWRINKDKNIELPETVEGMTLHRVIEGLKEGMPDHNKIELPSDSRLALIAKRIKPGQKLCNVRGGATAVHTWDIPEVFGKTTKAEKTVLEILLKLRRRLRVRDFGDADPVSARALVSELGGPVKKLLQSLENKGYVRRLGGKYDLVNTFNGTFRRLQWDKSSPTVHTQFGNPRYFLHPEENRGLTVREAARIQGFPDSFIFQGHDADKYRLVGNAVPPPMGYCLANIIKNTILT